MTETVDQAQAQPPRALAGIIEDATSLSFVSTSHFEGSRGGRLVSRRHAVLRQSSHIRIGYPIHHFRGVNLPTHRGHLQQFARTQDEPALPRAVTVMAVPDPPAKPAQAADAAAGSPAWAGAPPSRRAEATATTAASSAKVTAGTAPYVTRPTGWTVFLRTFVPWQLWRFVRINAKMIRIIRRPRTSRR